MTIASCLLCALCERNPVTTFRALIVSAFFAISAREKILSPSSLRSPRFSYECNLLCGFSASAG